MEQVTVEQAARILDIKEEAVRKRISRGTLRTDKDENGRLLVYVDGDETVRDQYQDGFLFGESGALISCLEGEIAFFQQELEHKDHLLAAALERIPAIEAPQDAPESPAPRPGTAAPADSHEDAQAAIEHVSWWRRMFGT
jgi:hypothetical protein